MKLLKIKLDEDGTIVELGAGNPDLHKDGDYDDEHQMDYIEVSDQDFAGISLGKSTFIDGKITNPPPEPIVPKPTIDINYILADLSLRVAKLSLVPDTNMKYVLDLYAWNYYTDDEMEVFVTKGYVTQKEVNAVVKVK